MAPRSRHRHDRPPARGAHNCTRDADGLPVTDLRDPRSGLLTEAYFDVAVPERVAMARRGLRPLSLVLVRCSGAPLRSPESAALVRACLRASDTACQRGRDELGLVLEDTPEDGAVWTAERLRRDLEGTGEDVAVWAGIATYPAHSLDAAGLVAAAAEALEDAARWPGSRIEVARPA